MSEQRSFVMTVAVEVDEGAWEHIYAPEGPLRADVASYLEACLSQSAAAQEGALLSVEVLKR